MTSGKRTSLISRRFAELALLAICRACFAGHDTLQAIAMKDKVLKDMWATCGCLAWAFGDLMVLNLFGCHRSQQIPF